MHNVLNLYEHSLFLVDGRVSVDGVRETLGMFRRRQQPNFMFDRTLEILHKMASDKNKSKRGCFLMSSLLIGRADIVW